MDATIVSSPNPNLSINGSKKPDRRTNSHPGSLPQTPQKTSTNDSSQDAVVIDLTSKKQNSEGTVAKLVDTEENQSSDKSNKSTGSSGFDKPLDDSERKELEKLKRRDKEVRAHEQAHLSALGKHKSSGASFKFEVGPDGKTYATSGEVSVDVSPEDTPEKTVQKARTIRRAALAPQNPSGADRSVAAKAAQLEAKARSELLTDNSQSTIAEEHSVVEPTTSNTTTKTENITNQSSNKEIQPINNPISELTSLSATNSNTDVCPLCGATLTSDHSHFNAIA